MVARAGTGRLKKQGMVDVDCDSDGAGGSVGGAGAADYKRRIEALERRKAEMAEREAIPQSRSRPKRGGR